jgi:hypothetical protein
MKLHQASKQTLDYAGDSAASVPPAAPASKVYSLMVGALTIAICVWQIATNAKELSAAKVEQARRPAVYLNEFKLRIGSAWHFEEIFVAFLLLRKNKGTRFNSKSHMQFDFVFAGSIVTR